MWIEVKDRIPPIAPWQNSLSQRRNRPQIDSTNRKGKAARDHAPRHDAMQAPSVLDLPVAERERLTCLLHKYAQAELLQKELAQTTEIAIAQRAQAEKRLTETISHNKDLLSKVQELEYEARRHRANESQRNAMRGALLLSDRLHTKIPSSSTGWREKDGGACEFESKDRLSEEHEASMPTVDALSTKSQSLLPSLGIETTLSRLLHLSSRHSIAPVSEQPNMNSHRSFRCSKIPREEYKSFMSFDFEPVDLSTKQSDQIVTSEHLPDDKCERIVTATMPSYCNESPIIGTAEMYLFSNDTSMVTSLANVVDDIDALAATSSIKTK